MNYEGQDRRHNSEDIAILKVEVAFLKTQVAEIAKDVKCLLSVVNQTRGGWKVIMLVAGVAGTAGALIGNVIPLLR